VTPLPPRTPITELGLTAAAAKGLTPAAKKLTRGDLVAMMTGEMPRAAQALTVKDLTSISRVFAASAKASFILPRPTPGCCCCSCGGGCCCCCCVRVADV
jgi:hypothetical protein